MEVQATIVKEQKNESWGQCSYQRGGTHQKPVHALKYLIDYKGCQTGLSM